MFFNILGAKKYIKLKADSQQLIAFLKLINNYYNTNNFKIT